MDTNRIITYPERVMLPEKFYEACVTCNIINYFKEKRAECVFPFSVSPVREKQEGYDFAYEVKDKIFLLQFKRPNRNESCYRWDIDIEQLKVIVNNTYASVAYYALPQFDDYKMWYQVLSKKYVKFIDAISLQKYLAKTGKKSINSSYEELKDWEQVVFELFGMNSYNSALKVENWNYQKELMTLLELEEMVGYEVE